MASARRDRCVSVLHCDTPIDPDLYPTVCRYCRPGVDADLDDFYTENDPDMAELHHGLIAESAGYDGDGGDR